MSGFHPKDLIKEVKKRPGIYNKDELVHPKRDHKHQLWMEVAECLTPTEDWESYTDVEKEARMDEISTKWKHLKDHFYREIKLQEAGEAHKKRKYIYFDDLEFMRPFVGFKLPSISKRKKSSDSLDNQDLIDNDADIDMDTFLKCGENVEEDGEYKMEDTDDNPPDEHRKSNRIIKPTSKTIQHKARSNSPLAKPNTSTNKNVTEVKKPGLNPNNQFKVRDGDIAFSLSLVPTLRKLGDGMKLRAKIDILKILQNCVDDAELKKAAALSNVTHTKPTVTQAAGADEDMPEDHLEYYEENISIKHEQYDDPLNSSGSNNKSWWN